MGHYLHDRGPDHIYNSIKPDAIMSIATDKNGVELKVGDRVWDGAGKGFEILELLVEEEVLCEHWGLIYLKWAGELTQIDPSIEPPRFYTEAEMGECFEAGINRGEYQCLYGCDAEYFAPDFEEFIQSLNTPKP